MLWPEYVAMLVVIVKIMFNIEYKTKYLGLPLKSILKLQLVQNTAMQAKRVPKEGQM